VPLALRFRDWPMRAKMTVLLVAASLLPLGVATWTSIQNARNDQRASSAALLAARAEELTGRIDTFNRGYQRAARRVALVPDLLDLLADKRILDERARAGVNGVLAAWPASDPAVRGVAVLDATGTVVVGTEPGLVGRSMAYRSFVQRVLHGEEVITDVFIGEPEVASAPTIGFLTPMLGRDKKVIGVAALWVHGSALRYLLRSSNELAGPGSFAVVFDGLGIRIAQSLTDELLFTPGVPLSPQTVEALVSEQRFGARTRELLGQLRQVAPEFGLASAAGPPLESFRSYVPGNRSWNMVVGRRSTTTAWTSYYLLPESAIEAQMARMVREKLVFATAIMFVALMVGALFAAMILRPIARLSTAARALGAGDLSTRVSVDSKDELGELGANFNVMAGRMEEQAAALVRESEAQYRRLFESLNDGFCTIEVIFDDHSEPVDYRFLEVNPAFEAQTGLRDVRGRLVSELLPGDRDKFVRIYGRVAQTGESLEIESDSNQLGRHFHVRAYRIGGPHSRRVAILFNDITERRDSQRKLQTQFERLDLLQQITRAIGERHDLASIYQVVVRTLEDRLPMDFGCVCRFVPEDEVLEVVCVGLRSQQLAIELELTERKRIPIDQNGLARCVSGQLVCEPDVGEVPFAFPARLARAGLRSLVLAPLSVESQVFGVLVAARRERSSFASGDCEFLQQLSEHVALAAHQAQLYSALQSAYENLRHTQQTALQQERLRALGQMASGIAHDINNAISPAALYTDSLLERESGLSASGRSQLQTVQRAVNDVAETVARMREFYRPREAQLALAPVQLNELVPQVVELTRARWSTIPQQRGVTIALHLDLHAGLPVIMAAESEIREALINLVFNAVDAMPDGGTLTLRTRTASGRVLIEVTDTGIGMDEDARRRCLEPFFTTKGERGTGLGLPMVYGTVQRHSAQIDIDSTPGGGTTVCLSFAPAPEGQVVPEPVTSIVPAGLRILLIDDDPMLLQSLRDALETDGHIVTAAHGGREGVEIFRTAAAGPLPFDVVLTDLGMPYMDGRQVAEAIKERSTDTPVIMLTGWGQRLMADGDVPDKVDLMLSKPPKLRDLRAALARCCAPTQRTE